MEVRCQRGKPVTARAVTVDQIEIASYFGQGRNGSEEVNGNRQGLHRFSPGMLFQR